MEQTVLKVFLSNDNDVCNIQIPIINNVEEMFKSRVKFENINAEQNQEMIYKYKIIEFPTMIIEKNGQEKERFTGLTQELFLKKALKKILSERL
jgi:thioredoxin-like negative regulator of GroEL